VTLDVEVHTPAGPVRLRAPLASALPVATLIDTLAGLLELPAADWVATLDGAPLEPFHILDDRPLHARSALVVRRA
jgi:hypothetical protein